MKTLCLLFVTMIWAALMPGTGYAVPSSPASQSTTFASFANTASGHPRHSHHSTSPRGGRFETGEKAADSRRDHGRPSDMNHPLSRASLTKVNHTKPLANNRPRSLTGNSMNHPQLRSDKLGGAASGGFVGNAAVHNPALVQTESAVRPAAPSLNPVRHRSPNPAVVGGSLNSHSGNTGVLDGT